ncbi:hypothetical protein AU192_24735 [Mycobacterium lehmannii]|uniref:Uncharacterized protein n=1 Tax=Mycobacterium lehmannii TaxID=2048550 RepID=A0A124EP54_9MYCO|nr:AAA family ATPase [Mycobacterium lehmannii]KUI13391.1 hypothetical protein AU192_24735 [Mycobacterium lehmannii]
MGEHWLDRMAREEWHLEPPLSGDNHPLRKKLRDRKLLPPKATPPPRPGTDPSDDPDRAVRYAEGALRREVDNVLAATEGCRNHTLFQAAANLRRYIRAGLLNEAEVTAQLADAARHVGLDDREIGDGLGYGTIASGYRKDDASGERDADIPEREMVGPAAEFDPGEDAAEPRFKFKRGGTFALDRPAHPEALWGDGAEVGWAAGESLLITSLPGVGKTTLAHQLLLAQLGIGDGRVLGYPVKPRDGVIVYLAMDRPVQIARALARRVDETDRAVLDERLLVWEGPPPADLARQVTLMRDMCLEAGASTLYVDSLKDAAVGLTDDEVGAGYNRARQLVIQAGIEVCELHHTIKRSPTGGKPGREVADVYGSTWLVAGCGSVIMLEGQPGDPVITLRHLRQPAAEIGPLTILADRDAGLLEVCTEDDPLEVLRAAGPDGMTAKQMAESWLGADDRSAVERARRKLDWFVGKGLAYRDQAAVTPANPKPPAVWFISTAAEVAP